MITELSGLPAGVTGFEISGHVVVEDFRDVVIPALTRAAASGEIRFLIAITSFSGMSSQALWEDLKLGFEHLRAFKRIALVTDVEWIRHLTALFGWMTPGDTKVFATAAHDEAVAWVAA